MLSFPENHRASKLSIQESAVLKMQEPEMAHTKQMTKKLSKGEQRNSLFFLLKRKKYQTTPLLTSSSQGRALDWDQKT